MLAIIVQLLQFNVEIKQYKEQEIILSETIKQCPVKQPKNHITDVTQQKDLKYCKLGFPRQNFVTGLKDTMLSAIKNHNIFRKKWQDCILSTALVPNTLITLGWRKMLSCLCAEGYRSWMGEIEAKSRYDGFAVCTLGLFVNISRVNFGWVNTILDVR